VSDSVCNHSQGLLLPSRYREQCKLSDLPPLQTGSLLSAEGVSPPPATRFSKPSRSRRANPSRPGLGALLKATGSPQKGDPFHPRRASLSRPGLDALIPAVRGSMRYSKPPAHHDALSQPSGSRRATPSRRLTRHVSTSTGAPNTSHKRTQSLSNNPRTCVRRSLL